MNPINVHFSKPLEFLLLAPSGDEGVATSVRLCGSNLSRALNLHLSGSGLSQVSLRLRSQRSHEKKGSLSHWWSWILQPVRNSLESKTACSKAIFIGVKCELHTVKCQADDIRWGVTPDTGQWPPGTGGWSVSPSGVSGDQSEASIRASGQSEAGDKSLELRVFMAEIFLPFKDTVGWGIWYFITKIE